MSLAKRLEEIATELATETSTYQASLVECNRVIEESLFEGNAWKFLRPIYPAVPDSAKHGREFSDKITLNYPVDGQEGGWLKKEHAEKLFEKIAILLGTFADSMGFELKIGLASLIDYRPRQPIGNWATDDTFCPCIVHYKVSSTFKSAEARESYNETIGRLECELAVEKKMVHFNRIHSKALEQRKSIEAAHLDEVRRLTLEKAVTERAVLILDNVREGVAKLPAPRTTYTFDAPFNAPKDVDVKLIDFARQVYELVGAELKDELEFFDVQFKEKDSTVFVDYHAGIKPRKPELQRA